MEDWMELFWFTVTNMNMFTLEKDFERYITLYEVKKIPIFTKNSFNWTVSVLPSCTLHHRLDKVTECHYSCHKVNSWRLIYQQGLIRNIDRRRSLERNQERGDMELLHHEKQPWPAQWARIKSHDEKATHHSVRDRWVATVFRLASTLNMVSADGQKTKGEDMEQKRTLCFILSLLFLSLFSRDGWNLSHERWRSHCIIHPADLRPFSSGEKLTVFQRMMDVP